MRYATLMALLLVPVLAFIFVNESNTLITGIDTIPGSVNTIVHFIPFSLIIVSAFGLITLVAASVYVFMKK